VGVERVALEDHRDVALLRRQAVDHLIADDHLALADVLEAGDHPQRGGLPAARRADEDDELPVLDLEIEVLHGLGAVREALPDAVELDFRHGMLPRVGVGPQSATAALMKMMRVAPCG